MAAVMKSVLAFLLLVIAVPATAGQTPAAGEEPTAVQMMATAPQPGDRGVQATAGFQIQEGPTSTKGFSVSMIAAHTLENRDLSRFDLEWARTFYKASPTAEFVKIEDNLKAENVFLHFLNKRWAAIGAAYYRRNPVIQLDYRAYVDAGIGVQAIDTRRVKLLAAVGYAVGRERRKFLPEAEKVLAVGFRDSLVVMVTPTSQFEQSLLFQVDTSRSGDKTYDFETSFATRISRHASFRVFYQRQYDTLHPVTVPKLQSTFGGGLSINFQRPPSAAPKPKP
jgi:putative salt-induced outer membrane protein YdiY